MISDEQLLGYLFDEGLAEAQRRQIEAALAADPALRGRLQGWRQWLDRCAAEAVRESPQLPAAMQARWLSALAREQRLARPAPRTGRRWWPLAMAATVLATFAISVERWRPPALDSVDTTRTIDVAAIDAGPSSPALQRGVALHLASTRAQLAQWPGEAQAQADLLAMSLAQNRLHAAAAEAQGDQELARVLRAFELTLGVLAEQRQSDPSAVAGTRQRLAFELGAMQTKLAAAASKGTQPL